jgi:dipeptidyl aminopeptidase/acylaminoacyl peptidase
MADERTTIPIERCIVGRDLTEARLHPTQDLLVYVQTTGGVASMMLHRFDGSPDRQLTSLPPPRPGRGLGGGCWCFSGDGAAVIYVANDGQLWWQQLDGTLLRRLTNHPPERSASSPVASVDGRRIVYTLDQAEVWNLDPNRLDTHRLDGERPADFVSDPEVTPCGTTVWWLAWDVPDMPWDGARVEVVQVDGSDHDSDQGSGHDSGQRQRSELRVGGAAVQQMRATHAGPALYLSDEGGWLNLWCDGAPLLDEPFEHGSPLWGPGARSFAVSPDERSIAFTRNDHGFGRLSVLDRETGEVRAVARAVHGQLSWVGTRLAAIRTGAKTPSQIVVYDTETWQRSVVAVGALSGWEQMPLAEPEVVLVDTGDGDVHARLFRPDGPSRGLLVWIHGGPTDQWQVTWMPRIAWWRAQGFHVLLPDHRGSTGHGRAYQQALRGRWGELDVLDTLACIAHAHRSGWATPATTLLVGGSAGGFTALNCIADGAPVAGAMVSYPVSDLVDLAERSHRFERHYTDTLVGPLPESADLYRARSPLHRVDALARLPLLVLHGADDPVVPVDQSIELAQAIAAAGGDCELHVYADEGHGFRQPAHQIDEYRRMLTFARRVVGPHC